MAKDIKPTLSHKVSDSITQSHLSAIFSLGSFVFLLPLQFRNVILKCIRLTNQLRTFVRSKSFNVAQDIAKHFFCLLQRGIAIMQLLNIDIVCLRLFVSMPIIIFIIDIHVVSIVYITLAILFHIRKQFRILHFGNALIKGSGFLWGLHLEMFDGALYFILFGNAGLSFLRCRRFLFVVGNFCRSCYHVMRKWFGLSVTAIHPLLKTVRLDSGHDNSAPILPTLFIVGKIGAPCLFHTVKAKHHLVFVKRAIGVVLVNDKHIFAVPLIHILCKEHVYMVSVHALRATNISVGVVHIHAPLLAVGIRTAALASLWVFDGNVKRANLHVAHFVVTCLLLGFGGGGFYFG